MTLSPNLRGAILMSLSMAGFVLNDTAMKYGGADIGIFQAIFVRGLFAVALMSTFVIIRRALAQSPSRNDLKLIGWRTLAETCATFAFVTALFNMPLANATAILQLTPLAIAAAAALVFKETLSSRQIIAILIGFSGVLLMIRPGAGDFNIYAILCLIAVICSVIRDLAVRGIQPSVSSLLVAYVATIGITLASGLAMAFTQTWTPLQQMDILLLAVSACFLSVGYFCAVAAMRVGVMALVSYFRYSILIWALALGWFVFGEIPSVWTFLGMAILVAAGLFLVSARGTTKQSHH